MRKDINKVICERERSGSRDYMGSNKGFEKQYYFRHDDDRNEEFAQLEALPKKEGMMTRLHGGYGGRTFGENLGPIRGMIESNVGKNWDKLFSDLCKLAPPTGNNVQRHAHQHIDNYIIRETKWIDGQVCVEDLNNKYYHDAWVPLKIYVNNNRSRFSRNQQYYVHPKTRCVMRIKRPKQQNGPKEDTRGLIRTTKGCYGKINGVWWELILEPARYQTVENPRLQGASDRIKAMIPATIEKLIQKDIAIEHVGIHGVQAYRMYRNYDSNAVVGTRINTYGADLVCVRKRQLSRKELNALGVSNDDIAA